MEYLLTRKRQVLGFIFSSNDPFNTMANNYACSYASFSIPTILSVLHKNYDIKKVSVRGGVEIDYYALDTPFFLDKRKRLKHNIKNNTLTLLIEDGLPASSKPTWDAVSNKRIATLDPRLQNPARGFINTVEEELGLQLRVVQATRTIAEQNTLYNQGRTTPGKIVTNARGGTSYHNYALAIDVVMMKNGQADWSVVPNDVVEIGKRFGFEWGGDWKKFKDYPHFQMTFGKSIRELSAATVK
ncbi:M15 family metallopeptidase [Pedobacter nutrimenti]|uniref:D-alanyl-D-alanine carboxypeptidase-like protein n=1 Tax=Pedobacter nutrimenti TaxID=1241337 RepID=A0A318UD59_9SPHI|nr:M15 family metallopeptidase [Pedobacter nutrimenti]PYF74334.1 D-alanyl-D-alanine carboxypeptidase-like protein [Pedobacter nutrimenti]